MTSEREWGCYPQVTGIGTASSAAPGREFEAVRVKRCGWDGRKPPGRIWGPVVKTGQCTDRGGPTGGARQIVRWTARGCSARWRRATPRGGPSGAGPAGGGRPPDRDGPGRRDRGGAAGAARTAGPARRLVPAVAVGVAARRWNGPCGREGLAAGAGCEGAVVPADRPAPGPTANGGPGLPSGRPRSRSCRRVGVAPSWPPGGGPTRRRRAPPATVARCGAGRCLHRWRR